MEIDHLLEGIKANRGSNLCNVEVWLFLEQSFPSVYFDSMAIVVKGRHQDRC